MEHDVVWERANGPIPEGYHIHHKNEDKLDNRLSNLELITPLRHKRHHSGCVMRDGVWMKPCRKCGKEYPVDTYYKRKNGISPWCRSCCIENANMNKQKRKATCKATTLNLSSSVTEFDE